MALEFNADKEKIKSSNLEIQNDTTLQVSIGGDADKRTALYSKTTDVEGDKLIRVGINTTNPQYELDVEGQIRTTTSIISDTARINNLDIDTIVNPELRLRAPILETYTDPDTGEVFWPTSQTPAFRDDSNRIATTNFVYNIATNDVGGRIYVSEQIGDDTFDGRSATKPVKTIKRGAQLASLTEQKETLIVAGGEYLEDNPISLPPKCSVVGDNIRLVICRPRNAGKHMFKAANENYIFGITFRDQLADDLGNTLDTWGFAYVFDDKQRMFYDKNLGGEFGRNFEVGHQFFGSPKFRIDFSSPTAVSGLEIGVVVTFSSGGSATITDVQFNQDSNSVGYFIVEDVTGAITNKDDVEWTYNGGTETIEQVGVRSQRIEGEVVRHYVVDPATDTFTVLSVEATDDYPDGLIFEVDRYHEYEVGQYIDISGFASSGTWGDLARFNGRQKISHRIETIDGFSVKFVVYKDTPTDILGINGNGSGVYTPPGITCISSDNYVVLSLLNSPFKFDDTEANSFRFQDAVDLIQRNKDYIAEEALGRVQAEYPSATFDTDKCKRDIKHIINHVSHDLFYGGNAATIEAAQAYLDGGLVSFVNEELEETKYGFREARELALEAMRNILPTGTYTSIAPYIDNTIIVDPTQAVSNNAADAYRLILKNKNLIAHEAFYLMTQQFPSWTPPNGTDNQDCIDDILTNIDVVAYNLVYGGNDRTYDAANVYVTNTLNGVTYPRTIEDGERDESVYAYEQARDLAIDIIRNNIISIGGSHGYTQYRDLSITVDPASPTCQTEASAISTLFGIITQAIGTDAGGVGNLTGITRTEPTVDTSYGLGCTNVASAIYNLFDIVLDILDGNAVPAITYPTSYIEDADGRVIAVRDPWDDLPIIEVSPYIFNSSVISFEGGGGCLIDGTKVATPNVPRPGAPEQGKSMVAAAFTIITFGGTGYAVIKDGYCQLVSCFVLFAQDGILAETGGYASVTNSATNFGTYALRATGYREEPYSFHNGTIEAVIFDEQGIPTLKVNSLGGPPLEHYVIKIGGVIPDEEGEEYYVEKVTAKSGSAPYTVEFTVSNIALKQSSGGDPVNIIGNTNRFNDAYNLLYNNAEYIGDEAVGIVRNLATLSTGQFDAFTGAYAGEVVEDASGNYYITTRAIGIGEGVDPTSDPVDPTTDPAYFEFISSTSSLPFQSDVEKCRRDTKLMTQAWATDLLQDANANTWDAAKLYIDGTNGGVVHITGYEASTKAVFAVANVLSRFAINNMLRKSTYTPTAAESLDQFILPYIAQYSTLTPYRDETIIDSEDDVSINASYDSVYTYADCANVRTAIENLHALTVEILDETEVASGLTRTNGAFELNLVTKSKIIGKDIAFHRPSIVNSSSHTWEYSGSGNDYNALPQNGGQTGGVSGNAGNVETKDFEQVSQNYGRVYSSGTDELGDFKIGYFAKVENRTGNITFGGTVEISEVSFLKISGGDITIEGFSTDNNLGGTNAKDIFLPTQKAVRDFITNNLGNFINKSYSTNPTPRALVELGDNGRINIDQLPALRPFNVYTVADEAERLALEGPLAGDIAIQQDTSLSYILNNDLAFQILEFAPDDGYTFNVNDIITAVPSTSQAEVSQYIHGYIDNIFITDPGTNYTVAPTVTIGIEMPQNSTVYAGEQVSNNTEVYTITNIVDLSLTTPTAPTHTSGVVTSDSIEYTWIGGSWTTATAYQVGDYVVNSNDVVYQITAVDTLTGAAEPTHTSGSVTIDGFTYLYVGPAWSATATYEGGEIVGNSGNAYSLKVSLTTGTTEPTHNTGTVTIDGVDYTYAGVRATATASISNGRVSTLTITNVGSGYVSDPKVFFDDTGTNGSGASATATARSRLFIEILNNIKVNAGDQVEDFTSPDPYHVTILDVINTSAQDPDNWVQLTSSNIDASFITSGLVATSRLGEIDADYPANSTSFLRGDQKYGSVVQFLRKSDAATPILLGSDFTSSSYIDQVRIVDGGTNYTVGTYRDANLFGGDGDGAISNIRVSDGAIQKFTVTNGGSGYLSPPEVVLTDGQGNVEQTAKAVANIFAGAVSSIDILEGGSGLTTINVALNSVDGAGGNATATATISDGVVSNVTITDGGLNYTADYNVTPLPASLTVTQGVGGDPAEFTAVLTSRIKYYNTVDIDVDRINGNTPSANNFSTVGVVKVWKDQFNFFSDGGIQIKEGDGVGLDADKLDGQEGNYYLNGEYFIDGSIVPAKLAVDDFNINILGTSKKTELLLIDNTATIDTQPQSYQEGFKYDLKLNSTNGLDDGGSYHSLFAMRRLRTSPTDYSFGALSAFAFTDNNNLFLRGSGSNFVSALTVTDGGNGYLPGTYSNVPLGGGEGSGLTADIVVNNDGVITTATLVNKGHGYNKSDNAAPTFVVLLPQNYFGLDNGRGKGYTPWQENTSYNAGDIIYVGVSAGRDRIYQVSASGSSGIQEPTNTAGSDTPSGSTAEFTFIGYIQSNIVATVAPTTVGAWDSFKKVWHSGNDGIDSGLDADKLDGRQLSWTTNALNINQGTLSNRRLPSTLSQKDISNRIRVVNPDSDFQTTQGSQFYDIYLEGYIITDEFDYMDTDPIKSGTQLNLYTTTNTNEGTVTVLEVNVNTEEADFYWTANTAYAFDRIIQYGYNLYLTDAVISSSGTTPPQHLDGTINNLTFIGKVQNPWTMVTAEVISGNFNNSVVRLGNADAPATYFDIADWSITKNSNYLVERHTLTSNGAGWPTYILGNQKKSTTNQILFQSSGSTFVDAQSNPDPFGYDVALRVSGGSTTVGTGNMDILANNLQVNGNIVWHQGNVQFVDGIFYPAEWAAGTTYATGDRVSVDGDKIYTISSPGATQVAGSTAPSHTSGAVTIDGIEYTYTEPDTYDTAQNGKGVIRDPNGNVAFNRVIGSLVGAASLNVLKTGDTMSGDLQFNQTGTGIKWSMNTDGAGIFFKNTSATDTNSYLEYYTADDGNEYHVWTHYTPSSDRRELMRLEQTAVDPDGADPLEATYAGNEQAKLTLSGELTFSANSVSTITTQGTSLKLIATNTATDTDNAKIILGKSDDTTYGGQLRLHIGGNDDAYFFVGRETSGSTVATQLMQINKDGNAVIGTNAPTTNYKLKVEGTFAATSKSFVIDHPTKENYQLVYGSLEGPEHGVYVRGKVTDGVIELPDYWTALVDEDTITVQLTPIGDHHAWVDKIEENKVYISGGESFYFVQAERKDINKLQTEVELTEE